MPRNTTSTQVSAELPVRESVLAQVRQLVEWYGSGEIPRLAQHEVHPELPLGDRENYLYFTLPVCVNFQRSSPAMWTSALRTWQDAETRFVFFPELLAQRSIEVIRSALTKHGLALQPNKHVLIWTTIARSFHDFYHDDPRELITEAGSDAGGLVRLLQGRYRKRFPYLSGPKLSNYWPYILSYYTDVRFSHIDEISIIPDTRILQSSVRLGVTLPGTSSVVTAAAWQELLAGSGLAPADVHPVLWHWSRNGFKPAPS